MPGRLTVAIAVAAAVLAALTSLTTPCDALMLRAGAAMVPMRVPPGTPLGGYGAPARRLFVPDVLGRYPHAFWLRPHEGTLDAPAARALVLEQGATRLVWIAADLIAVDRAFTDRVAAGLREAGIDPGTLIVSASHTHSGPGAFLSAGLLGFVAVDRLDESVRDALTASLVDAVRRADAARVAVRVGSARLAGPPLTVGRLGLPVDQELIVLKLVAAATGAPVAVLWNFAIHPTMLGPANLRLSGDITGLASRAIERDLGVPALYVNGAVGDVSPGGHGMIAAEEGSQALARSVRRAWERIETRDGGPLVVRSSRLELSRPHLSLRNCAGRWVPASLRVSLARWLPREADLVGAAVGGTAWVTVPGELQSRLGTAVKDAGREAGWPGAIAGLSNGYLGYFLTSRDYERVTYVACTSLYGPSGGERITRAASDLVRTLAAAVRR